VIEDFCPVPIQCLRSVDLSAGYSHVFYVFRSFLSRNTMPAWNQCEVLTIAMILSLIDYLLFRSQSSTRGSSISIITPLFYWVHPQLPASSNSASYRIIAPLSWSTFAILAFITSLSPCLRNYAWGLSLGAHSPIRTLSWLSSSISPLSDICHVPSPPSSCVPNPKYGPRACFVISVLLPAIDCLVTYTSPAS